MATVKVSEAEKVYILHGIRVSLRRLFKISLDSNCLIVMLLM